MSASSGATAPTITVSVVSHAQRELVQDLLADLARLDRSGLDVIVTLNVAEEPPSIPTGLAVQIVRNPSRKGFGANHNAAFHRATGAIFCVLNPDVGKTVEFDIFHPPRRDWIEGSDAYLRT